MAMDGRRQFAVDDVGKFVAVTAAVTDLLGGVYTQALG